MNIKAHVQKLWANLKSSIWNGITSVTPKIAPSRRKASRAGIPRRVEMLLSPMLINSTRAPMSRMRVIITYKIKKNVSYRHIL